MIRFASTILDEWLGDSGRKPLIIRGARQVGKTWLVRDLAERHNRDLVELNFERTPRLLDLFSDETPVEILDNIGAYAGRNIDPDTALLFLDEIQNAPEVLAKLRWFQEDMPTLPVIAAGSLLEFALRKFAYSMPVGRVSYFYLEPMSFFEFLLATDNEPLLKKLKRFNIHSSIPEVFHTQCLRYYHDYCLIGGMPESINAWSRNNNLAACFKIQQDLLATYRDDFHKYGGEMDARLLDRILLSVSEQLGNKFIYSRVHDAANVAPVKNALNMLALARVCTKVMHTSGNGLPLGAESNEKFFKALMLDIGLVSAQLGLAKMSRAESTELVFQNKGGLAEQFVGQQLRCAQSPLIDPSLYYWQRIGGRQGEIDYILQGGNRVIPVEVKSGAAGSMKSLHQFMADKKLDIAIRCNTQMPSAETLRVKTTQGDAVVYRLISIPIYLSESIYDVIRQVTGNARE